MEFFYENIYKTAIDNAREENHKEIVDLLSKGLIKGSKVETE